MSTFWGKFVLSVVYRLYSLWLYWAGKWMILLPLCCMHDIVILHLKCTWSGLMHVIVSRSALLNDLLYYCSHSSTYRNYFLLSLIHVGPFFTSKLIIGTQIINLGRWIIQLSGSHQCLSCIPLGLTISKLIGWSPTVSISLPEDFLA
jgi:hypothetical protein